MALSARLEIRQGQGLVITPQLQQAIKLLQLSNLELEAFVDGELERNPLLQRDEAEADAEAEPDAETVRTEVSADEASDSHAQAELDAGGDEASPGERTTGDAPEEGLAGGAVDWSTVGKGGYDGDLDGFEGSLTRAVRFISG